MAVHPPFVRRYVPPTEAEAATARAGRERLRQERTDRRERERPARRAALLAGPSLRDVEAALECYCSCHPRPGDLELHGGGPTCQCQRLPEEREADGKEWLAEWAELTEEFAESDRLFNEQRNVELAAEAVALGVSARIALWACPLVIVGTCDGRGFYLRERHGSYRVTIAADDDPSSDPWSADRTKTSIDIASGDEYELVADGRLSAAAALRVAVTAVRTALARNTCAHEGADGDYCPSCGVPTREADQWRWST